MEEIKAVELVRHIRDRIARETKGMSAKQLVAYYRRRRSGRGRRKAVGGRRRLGAPGI